MAYNEERDLYAEMINMVKVSGVRNKRVGTLKDFDLFVGEFAQTHQRLFNLLDKLEKTRGQYTRFINRGYKEALAYQASKAQFNQA